MSKKEQRYFFRCQYQIGDETISEKLDGHGYLSVSEMIHTILKLVNKVALGKGEVVGGEVALEALRAIHKLGINSDIDWIDR